MIKAMGFKEHAEEATSIKSIDELRPTYCTACLICDEIIEKYGYSICQYPVICDECKEANYITIANDSYEDEDFTQYFYEEFEVG